MKSRPPLGPTVFECAAERFRRGWAVERGTRFLSRLALEFDAVVAMYHDQGWRRSKPSRLTHGHQLDAGLPFIRTSPDHGTVYNIAGQGIARPSSMIAAIRLAKQLTRAVEAKTFSSWAIRPCHW